MALDGIAATPHSLEQSLTKRRLLASPSPPQTAPPAAPPDRQLALKWQRPVRQVRIGQRVCQGQQVIHTDQARVPDGAAFIGHAAGEQSPHRVEAAERMSDEARLVLITTKFV